MYAPFFHPYFFYPLSGKDDKGDTLEEENAKIFLFSFERSVNSEKCQVNNEQIIVNSWKIRLM